MEPMKFEIIIDDTKAAGFLLSAIGEIMKTGHLIKAEITKAEEEEE